MLVDFSCQGPGRTPRPCATWSPGEERTGKALGIDRFPCVGRHTFMGTMSQGHISYSTPGQDTVYVHCMAWCCHGTSKRVRHKGHQCMNAWDPSAFEWHRQVTEQCDDTGEAYRLPAGTVNEERWGHHCERVTVKREAIWESVACARRGEMKPIRLGSVGRGTWTRTWDTSFIHWTNTFVYSVPDSVLGLEDSWLHQTLRSLPSRSGHSLWGVSIWRKWQGAKLRKGLGKSFPVTWRSRGRQEPGTCGERREAQGGGDVVRDESTSGEVRREEEIRNHSERPKAVWVLFSTWLQTTGGF